ATATANKLAVGYTPRAAYSQSRDPHIDTECGGHRLDDPRGWQCMAVLFAPAAPYAAGVGRASFDRYVGAQRYAPCHARRVLNGREPMQFRASRRLVSVPHSLRPPLAAALFVLAVVAVLLASTRAPALADGIGPLSIAKRGHFFVGGKYVDTK